MLADLRDSTYVVTGAASGIGAAVTMALADAGAHVLAVDQVPLKDAPPPEVTGITADVRDIGALGSAVEEDRSIDGVVASAGRTGYGTADTLTPDEFRKVLEVNVLGIYNCLHAFLPALRRSSQPSFVAVASQLGIVGARDNLAYCASKSGVLGLVRAASLDHAAEGVRVNAVCPGPIETPMLEQQRDRMAVDDAGIQGSVPMGRHGLPQEVANVALFLLSARSSFITGAELIVDGGYSVQ